AAGPSPRRSRCPMRRRAPRRDRPGAAAAAARRSVRPARSAGTRTRTWSRLARVDGGRAVQDVVIDTVLGIGADLVSAVQPGHVGLVVTEQQLRLGTVGAGRADQL